MTGRLKNFARMAYGAATMTPGLSPLAIRAAGMARRGADERRERGFDSARYCYSVWLRHLVHARNSGLDARPKVTAEIGPGDSLGAGLAALLTGTSKHYAFDIVDCAPTDRNIQVFDELVDLFQKRAPIPDNSEFPLCKPLLGSYDFPRDILDERRMSDALNPDRIAAIRNSIPSTSGGGGRIMFYKVPWSAASVAEKHSVDMIFSQAAMEHVDDLRGAYRAMNLWLKPGGYVLHMIDFRAHHLSDAWNGHWAYGNLAWKLLRGKRPFLLNREPLSTHLSLLEECGFDAVCAKRTAQPPDVPRERLAARFRDMPEDDLTTSEALVQAIKRAELSQGAVKSV